MANAHNEKLIKSVKEKKINDVKQCLPKCSLSYSDWSGHTSLHIACMNGYVEIAELALMNGANVNQVCKFNKTALHLASQNGNLPIVRLLIKYDSDINARDMLNMTPVHWAVERNHEEVVELLTQQNHIDLTIVDKFNRTCLDIAKKNNNANIISLIENKLNDRTAVECELNKMETIFKNSSLAKLTETVPGLEEFYKKKCYVKSSSRPMMRLPIPVPVPEPSPSVPVQKHTPHIQNGHETNSVAISKSTRKKIDLDLDLDFDTESTNDDDEDDQEDIEERDSAKKKRLSMSPMNRIDETLKWILPKSSKSDFSNINLSLTEAGKMTLDYLNKNDPIREEKRLFLKLVKDLEEEEKCCADRLNISPRSDNTTIDTCLDDLLSFE